jgi:integrase
MQGRQAKLLTVDQECMIMEHVTKTRYPTRDKLMVLFSIKAGLRPKEIASLKWGMVTDAQGSITKGIAIPNVASKGKKAGRTIPMHPAIHEALKTFKQQRGKLTNAKSSIIYSERGGGMSPATVRLWFHRMYVNLGFDGCSSLSGRRTFITRAARAIGKVGGSIRDVQKLAGHARLETTQYYIESDEETRSKLVGLL